MIEPGIPDQQHTGVPVRHRLLPGGLQRGAPSPITNPEVAVQVREPRDHVAIDLPDLGAGQQLRPLVPDPTVHHPGLRDLLVGTEQDRTAKVQDRGGANGGAHASEGSARRADFRGDQHAVRRRCRASVSRAKKSSGRR